MLQRIIELVEDKAFDDVRLTLHLTNGQAVSGKIVSYSYALEAIALAHMSLAAALMDDDKTDYDQALTVRVAADHGEAVIRVDPATVCWWAVLPDPVDEL